MDEKRFVVLMKNDEPVDDVSTLDDLARYFNSAGTGLVDDTLVIGDTITVAIVDRDGNSE
jgi:hypothetical protein